jgi:hypothetical protein
MTRHIYSQFLSLQLVGVIIGILLIAAHAFALLRPARTQAFLKEMPRHKQIGIAILAVDFIWAFWLIGTIDLGEFYTWEKPIRIILPIAFVLFIMFVDEFLAVRATGIFFLLLACPMLDMAFLQPPATRLLVPLLAYIWIFFALFWVGMPYLMRDQIAWASKVPTRWIALSVAGVAYGVAMLVCALAFWGGVGA